MSVGKYLVKAEAESPCMTRETRPEDEVDDQPVKVIQPIRDVQRRRSLELGEPSPCSVDGEDWPRPGPAQGVVTEVAFGARHGDRDRIVVAFKHDIEAWFSLDFNMAAKRCPRIDQRLPYAKPGA